MPVLLKRASQTGVDAEYWVLTSVHAHRDRDSGQFEVSGRYGLWVSEATYLAGKRPMHDGELVRLSETGVEQFFAGGRDIDALFDEHAVSRRARSGEAAVARAQGAAEGATPAVAEEADLELVPGGPLEGGQIVALQGPAK